MPTPTKLTIPNHMGIFTEENVPSGEGSRNQMFQSSSLSRNFSSGGRNDDLENLTRFYHETLLFIVYVSFLCQSCSKST